MYHTRNRPLCVLQRFFTIAEEKSMRIVYPCQRRQTRQQRPRSRQGLAVAKLITHHYPLAEADTAFQEFAAGRTGKVLLRYDKG